MALGYSKQDFETLVDLGTQILNCGYMGAVPTDPTAPAGIVIEEVPLNGLYRRNGIEVVWEISATHFGEKLEALCRVYDGSVCDISSSHDAFDFFLNYHL